MPAVNSAGKTRIVQNDMPCAACVAEMPSRPISVAVSKPRPNRKPIGYMCQERDTTPEQRAENAGQQAAPGQQCIEVFVDDPARRGGPRENADQMPLQDEEIGDRR